MRVKWPVLVGPASTTKLATKLEKFASIDKIGHCLAGID